MIWEALALMWGNCDQNDAAECAMGIVSEILVYVLATSLQLRHNEHNGVSNHQRITCFLNRLFRGRSKKTSKLRVIEWLVGLTMGQ